MAITASEVAAKFGGITAKTFYNRRAELEAQGFPLPLNIRGICLLWDEEEVDAWFVSRRQAPKARAAAKPAAAGEQPVKRGRGRPRKDSTRGDAAWARVAGGAA